MKKGKHNRGLYLVIAAIFWLLVWQLVSMAVNIYVILPGPYQVLLAFGRMLPKAEFWKTILNSFCHIVLGFACAVGLGVLLAVAAHACEPFGILLTPIMKMIKAIPVASFIILILLWINSRKLPAVIAFLMVLPIIYTNVIAGIENTDEKLLEMAEVFRMKPIKWVRYIYLPAVMPFFVSAVKVGLGFCWKSGIAAEVIGLSPNTIGSKLYESKLYLTTDELFAWTIVIVIISALFEKMVMKLLCKITGTQD